MPNEPTERLLAKLRAFVTDQLDDEERSALAALLAPGIALAYDEVEVAGFAMVEWPGHGFPDTLAGALRRAGIRVEGLGGDAHTSS